MTVERTPVEVLHGSVADVGAVLRVGDQVDRPTNPHSATSHRFLRHVRAHGFTGASEPVAIDGDRERVVLAPGDVSDWPTRRGRRPTMRSRRSAGCCGASAMTSTGFDVGGGSRSEELVGDDPATGP